MAPQHAHPRFRPQEVASALIEAFGNLSVAARRLGCDRVTVWRYVKRYEVCRKAVEEGRERKKDLAESKLLEAIRDRDPWAIQFYLRTQGRDRGYGDQLTLVGDAARPLVFHVTTHWPDQPQERKES